MLNSSSVRWEMNISHTLAPEVWKTDDLKEYFEIDKEFIEQKIGISERRFLPRGKQSMDLAFEASKKVLDKCNYDATDVDLIIYVTQNPDYILPQSSARLASLLECSSGTASFDLSLGCSGWVYALSLGAAFAEMQNFSSILLVTCDTYSPRIERSDKSMMSIFGDAAAATLLIRSKNGYLTIGLGDFGTDGRQGENLMCFGGALNDLQNDDVKPYIRMNGRKILEFMLDRIPSSVDACLKNNSTTSDKVQLYAFHQASEYMVRLLAKRMALPLEKAPVNIQNYGNTVSSSIPILLEDALGNQSISGPVIVSGFGVGLSWATNLLNFD
jgi:3-oxoacyl-[acyl-carrier-protein] synthase III